MREAGQGVGHPEIPHWVPSALAVEQRWDLCWLQDRAPAGFWRNGRGLPCTTPRLPRQDALKVLSADVSADPEYRARFLREADLASTLYHPHIVGVHDRGEYEGQLWISMDYVDGVDGACLLADRYRAGMPVEEVVRIVTAVGAALDYAHKRGLLHRDVKPANIMLTHLDDDDDGQRILLADFGIARTAGGSR
jgi:serine/threonine protein kinase